MALTKIDDRGLKTPIDLLDNEKVRLGTGNDLELYHDGSNSYLKNSTGMMRIQGTQLQVKDEDGNESLANFIPQGAVELYYDNSKKFETVSGGVSVNGSLVCGSVTLSGGGVQIQDADKFVCGNGDDLQIYHNGSNSFIQDIGTGNLFMDFATTFNLRKYQGGGVAMETVLKGTTDGSVELYYDNTKRFETTSYGAIATGNIAATVNVVIANDTGKFLAGASNDMQMYHDGFNSRLTSPAHNLYIQSDFISLLSADGVTTTFTSYGTGHITAGDSGTRTNFFGSSSTHKPHIQFSSANSNSKRGMSLLYGQSTTNGPYLILGKHRSNSINGTTAIQNGDELGMISFQGSDGTNFKEGARILVHANQTVSSGVIPGRMRFQVADASGNMQNRGGVHREAGITGIEHHQFVPPIIGSTDQGSTISNPVERFNAPAFNCADTGDFASFSFSTHWRHRSYANVSIWFGESGNASGNTYDIAVQVRSASSGQGYTNTNHTFNIDVGTFSNGRMRNLDFSGSWPTHGASRFVQGKLTFTKNISGTSLQYMGMRVVEYTDPA